jgi:hypothetical protein
MYSFILTISALGLFWLWLFLVVIQSAAAFLGTLLGRRLVAEAKQRVEATGLVTGGVLALTAFILAMTLSFGTGRMAERRTGALEEANAIGTAWLQATALTDPRAASIATQLEDYAVVRLAFAKAAFRSPELGPLTDKTNLLQTAIWADMTALLATRTDPHSVSLMNAINHVFDMTTSERLSLASGMPRTLVVFLVVMVCVSAAMAGFQLGLKRQNAPVLVGILFMLWSAVIVTVMDFGAPRLGSYRTMVEPYEWTISGFTPAP